MGLFNKKISDEVAAKVSLGQYDTAVINDDGTITVKRYQDEGQEKLSEVATYDDLGNRHGWQEQYDATLGLQSKVLYEHGNMVRRISVNSNGTEKNEELSHGDSISTETAQQPTNPTVIPNATQPTENQDQSQGINQAGNAGTPPPTQASTTEQPRATEETPAPIRQEAMLAPAISEGERHSFFNPDTEKGFFATLDKKVEEALRGNSPEEIAQNMAFAMLTILFEMIANACDHDRHEFKRLKNEFLKKISEREQLDAEAGIGLQQKALMAWSVVAAHPDMQQYLGKPISKDAVEKAQNIIKKDPDANAAFRMIVSAACGRKLNDLEFKKITEKAFKMDTGSNTIADLQGRALNDEVVKRGISLSGPRGNLPVLHRRWRDHAEEIRAHHRRREDLRGRRDGRSRTGRTPTHTRDNEHV